MKHDICDAEELEATVGRQPLAALMKSITKLDSHCAAILAYATAAVMVHIDSEGVLHTATVGGEAGFANPDSASHVAFETRPARTEPRPEVGSSAALLFLIPGWRESLRINGRIDATGLMVEEAFVHCGKAMIRSRLWSQPEAIVDAPTSQTQIADSGNGSCVVSESNRIDDAHRTFLMAAPFAVIGSCDTDGRADASPKGDPAGFIAVLDDHTVALPDRPGNRRTDTFHNLLERPAVTVLAMTPGDDRTLEIRGRARLTTDPALLATMAVKNQVPEVALVVDVDHASLQASEAVKRAALWASASHISPGALPRAAKIWADHVKSSDQRGLAAKAVRAGVSDAAVRAGIAVDYRRNLY